MIRKKGFSCIGYRLWSMVYRLFCISRRLRSVVRGLTILLTSPDCYRDFILTIVSSIKYQVPRLIHRKPAVPLTTPDSPDSYRDRDDLRLTTKEEPGAKIQEPRLIQWQSAVLLYTFYFLLSTPSHAQLLTPLSHEMNRRVEYEMIKSGTPFFTVLKPYVDTQLRGNVRQDSLNFQGQGSSDVILSSLPRSSVGVEGNVILSGVEGVILSGVEGSYDSSSTHNPKPVTRNPKLETRNTQHVTRPWLHRKLFHESLIQIDSGSYYLFLDPAFDLTIGQDNTGRKTFTNSRGFNAGGRLGKNFAFGTSFYENQAIFPLWVHKGISNKIITGQGFGRLNGQTWDYAHSSGYISFTPVKNLNIQLGQGKNFIGDGYRSLLLSDVAYNYPYGRITFMNKKWMYSWMLGIIQDLSIPKGNDQYTYAKRIISSHLVSANISPWLQFSIIKNTVYNNPDTTGKFSPGIVEFNPVILPVNVRNSHSIWGFNMKATIARTLWVYSQGAFDNLFGDGDMKTAFQAGVKYFNAFGLKGLYLQGEFNQAEAETYTWENKTLYWLHYREPLAHPAGNNFREGIFNAVFTWHRWQISNFSRLTEQQKPLAIIAPSNSTKFPSLSSGYKVFNNNTELSWYLNPKATYHFSLGYVIHHETIAGLKTKSSMVYFAFRTALFNNYLLSP